MALSAPSNTSSAASSPLQGADYAGFEGAINHLFLPPKLPHGEDPGEVDSQILDTTMTAVDTFRRLSPSPELDRVAALLRAFRAVHGNGQVDEVNLLTALHALRDGDVIPVQITAQNAAVLVTCQQDKLIFEAFELSPQNSEVYSTPGRLIRTFPAMAISVDASNLQQHDLADVLANTIATMSRQPVAGMQPESRKARQMNEEDRDTTDPAIVCGLLFGILRGFGSSHSGSTIRKHMREEVLWNNARRPWRRSPVWLLIRATLQLTMSRASPSGDSLYKKLVMFILSHMLDTALNMDLPAELYYAMNAKIERRRHKFSIGNSLNDPIGTSIANTLKRSSAKLESLWKTLQDRNARTLDLQVLKELDFRKDTAVVIPKLDSHIAATKSRHVTSNSSQFEPSTALVRHATASSLPSLPANSTNDYAVANLQQFEQWITRHLREWTNATEASAVCESLSRLIKSYHSLACSLYANNPEGISTMLLTIYEMWMHFDQAAVQQCPMLKEYGLGLPSQVLQNLLLPHHEQMVKLSEIEDYLSLRNAGIDCLQLFATDENGFASRYFDSSSSHQALLQSINSDAQAQRQSKMNELQRLQNEYRRLDALCRDSECETRTEDVDPRCDPPKTKTVHMPSCNKCKNGRIRDNLTILIHEWPLPTDPAEAKAVVFELDVPVWFADWRDARAYMLYDVLEGKSPKSHLRASFHLAKHDPHLRGHFRSKNHRIGLISEEKPMIITHYRERKLSTCDRSSVCVENGFKYRYYDSSASGFVQKPFFDHSMHQKCTYTLPTEVRSLQRFIFRPSSSPDGPAPNEVIADQQNCPDSMSLEEYKELSTIPLGHRIQWANILLQLAMPGVDFKKPETTVVFLQCINQAGPPSGEVFRVAHRVIHDDSMAQSVLENLQHALQRVKQNWESAQALNTFIAIAIRVMSLNDSIQDTCLSFLKHARATAINWIRILREKAHEATDHPSRTAFISKSVEIALICASSFDVDDRHLQAVLCSPEQTSLLHWCAIVVHEGKQADATKALNLALLDLRFKRLLHRTCHHLLQDPDGLNVAVKRAWSAFVPNTAGWKQVSKEANHWLTTTTATRASGNPIRVHYDLLTGELLANGLPLDQPPAHYRNKPLYQTLFGKAIVEVMPAVEPGFQFSTKRLFGDSFQVQLGLFNDYMVVRAKNSEDVWETVPTEALQGTFPAHFASDFVLWHCVAKNKVQLRPLGDPWNPRSPRNCVLSRTDLQSWTLSLGDKHILGLSSATSIALADILRPLAAASSIHCLLDQNGNSLSIEIPSIRLNFSILRGSTDLQSCEYRGRHVDQNQRLGTLVGFSNQLLLASKGGDNRIAIVLQSSLSYSKERGHTAVQVQNRAKAKIHAVEVDTSLCRLQDSSLDCKLYLAYLHALTSFCLPDPLTHRTGTEQALIILRSKAVKSFDQLSQENVDLLAKIADLTPVRAYYPANKREMQRVDWDDTLSFLSQHGQFSKIVSSLLQQSVTAQIFFPDTKLTIPRLKEVQQDLQTRDNIRSSSFRVSGFGADEYDTSRDQAYHSRERAHPTRAQEAAFISNLLCRNGHDLHYRSLPSNRIWQLMQKLSAASIDGASAPIDPSQLRYDAELLKTGFQHAIAKFPSLHRWSKDPQILSTRKFMVTVWISTLAFAEKADTGFLQLLALCFKTPQLAGIASLQPVSFNPAQSPSDGSTISQAEVTQIVRTHMRRFEQCPEHNLPRLQNERNNEYFTRRNGAWLTASEKTVQQVSRAIANQWRREVPINPSVADAATYIDMNKLRADITAKFRTWFDNSLLYEYLADVERAVKRLDTRAVQLPAMDLASPKTRTAMPGLIAEKDLFSQAAPLISTVESSLQSDPVLPVLPNRDAAKVAPEPPFASFLRKLRSSLGQLNASQSTYEADYIGDLERSLGALVLRKEAQEKPGASVTEAALSSYLAQCQHNVDSIYLEIVSSMRGNAGVGGDGQQFPRLSPAFFLKRLAHDHWSMLRDDWKQCIVSYGLALTEMQRAKRLVKLADGSRKADLVSELSNVGHRNWSPFNHPESLLIEIETGIMIREVQEQIAQEMRAPSSECNAVCQLNMGEGKSSVIVPIVAAGLADGSKLVRVLVGKPQSKQMAQMLISKMGGLVGRQIYFMPFSRSLKVDREGANAISNMLHECMGSGGILLVQPEHILSFKLMAPECYISGKSEVGRSIMSTQDFLDQHARDIVDESDENFSSRFELIYTMGMQRSIEMSPGRWFLMQQVLDLVRKVAPEIAKKLPDSIEISAGTIGAFAKIRLLRQDAEEMLVHCIAKHICQQGIEGFHLGRQPSSVRDAVYTYISKFELSNSEMEAVESSPLWTETTKLQLLMLRGLLAGGVLSFTLAHKRWRVNYGLACRDPPTRLAVPYRAKDSPTPRSEFSHPDVVIALTSLCYYYQGLSDEDMFTAMSHLINSDLPDIEYQAWVKDSTNMSLAFKQLQGINLKDGPQCVNELFPSLRFGKSVVDYFLSRIVFPKEMKEFPHKLSASGWDIGKTRRQLTTGFSGTNDSRHLLPLDVKHLDLPHQKHTNALVLDYLLQPQNGVHLMSSVDVELSGELLSDAHRLLRSVMRLRPAVEVILDVGAQILELTNLQMARTWLKLHDSTKEAVVFVNDDDEICVVDRQDRVDLLQTSSYQSRLDCCLVFLDEAHTRGIDLRLPIHYRAAVTLGANLTKDRLVQACMRLRKLGQGQTVVFCISEEIQAKILEATSRSSAQDITVADVLQWSIKETHSDTRRNMPLWAAQGERFIRQAKLWKAIQDQDGNTIMSKKNANAFLENEAQTIEDRYLPRRSHAQPSYLSSTTDPDLEQIGRRCRAFDDLQFDSGTLQEEQERELSPEIEQERQVQRAPAAKPTKHQFNEDVLKFATKGEIIHNSPGYRPAFSSLRFTSAAKSIPPSTLQSTQLLVTTDFAETVERKGASFVQDAFLRQVQWLLTRCDDNSNFVKHIMVVSPREANALCHMKYMHKSQATTLHLYKPHVNSGYSALPTSFHTISARVGTPVVPPSLGVQLDLFSGALYFQNHVWYKEMCKFLGMSSSALTPEMEKDGWKVDADGFILSDDKGRVGGESSMKQSPVAFFKSLLAMRRNGEDVSKTHLGALLEGKLFEESDFD